MNRSEFTALAEQAFAALPARLREMVRNAAFIVEDEPSARQYEENGVPDDEDLLGLYEGTPLTERGIDHLGLPDRIYLFQLPIEFAAEEDGVPVFDVVFETLVHEIGHHLGLDEEQIERIEAERRARG
jgi:predicted Zn-dependent protease with MMP-like domain